MHKEFWVKVPASSGNVGPGFDVLGLALDLYNDLRVKPLPPSSQLKLTIEGFGVDSVPRNRTNVIVKAIEKVCRAAGKKLPAVHLHCVNRIPLTRGLGSSSAALLSGLLAGNKLCGNRFNLDQILWWATEMEGHPDNVAPALLGGLQASAVIKNRVITSAWPLPKLKAVVAIPSFELATKKARKVVPESITMKDAVSNLAKVSLMFEAFRSRPERLPDLLNDCWHEPYRAKLVPGFFQVKKAALHAGGLGFILSGAGPTVLSFARKEQSVHIGLAMKKAFQTVGVSCETNILSINQKGAVVQ